MPVFLEMVNDFFTIIHQQLAFQENGSKDVEMNYDGQGEQVMGGTTAP